jgi:N-acetylmuramoyl-L-alanine amidase
MAKVYLSPSVQSHNIGVGDFGSEQYRMNLICDFAEVYLKAQGIETKRNNPNWKIANICGDSNAWRADRHIAIHSNAASKEEAQGTDVFYADGYADSKKLAQAIYDEVAPLSPGKDRGVKADTTLYSTGLGEVRGTSATSCLIEVGFHTNEEEAKWIMESPRAIGKAIAIGVTKDLGIAFKDPDVEIIPEDDIQKLREENTYLKGQLKEIISMIKELEPIMDNLIDSIL